MHEQITRFEYDVLDRSIATKRVVSPFSHSLGLDTDADSDLGTIIVPTSPGLATIATTTYDLGNVGDGHITRIRNYFGTGSTEFVETNYHRTFRGHSRGYDQKNNTTAFGPYQVLDIDWMGRTIALATYTSAPAWPTDYTNYVHDPTNNSNAGGPTGSGYNDTTITKYDALGRVYQVLTFPGTQSANRFEVNNYYDRNDNLVASGDRYGIQTEYAYDGSGHQYQIRIVKALNSSKFTSGKFNYVGPLPDPHWKADTSGVDTANVQSGHMAGVDDGVLEITHTVFDASGSAVQEHTFEAYHDDSDGIDFPNNEYVRRSVYNWFDEADRLVTSADYGSGDTASGPGAWKYTSLPGRPASAPTSSSDTKLVTIYTYNVTSGRQETTQDPAGIVTKTFYDDLGRRSFVAENHDDFEGAGDESDIGGGANNDEDRVTKWTYNGLGSVTILTAYNNSSSNPQSTKYLYENNYNSSLVTNTIYPDSSDTSSSGTDQVKVSYNLDGTPATRTDQRGVVLTYSYDNARRQTVEAATTLPGFVDSAVEAIVRTYDDLGRLEKITSYPDLDGSDLPDGSPVNEIQYAYTSYNRIYRIYQEHGGAVSTSLSPKVEFLYETDVDSNVYTNGLRRETVNYPVATNAKLNTFYGSSGNRYDLLHRPAWQKLWGGSALNGNAAHTTQYNFNGVSHLVGLWTESAYTNVEREMWSSSNNYSRLDRFGRPLKYQWKNRSTNAVLDEVDYTYDYAGNRLTRNVRVENVNGGYPDVRDQDYDYDGLHRVIDADQGDADGLDDTISDPLFEQRWTLDQLGNWSEFRQDTNGDADFTDATDWDQDRTHNAVNEITAITAASGQPTPENPTHDAAGNMSPMSDNLAIKYDAWNRAVATTNSLLGTLVTYEYDGLDQRIRKEQVHLIVGDDTFDYYYNDKWQLLTEVKDGTEISIYHWHPFYIDALGVRMRSGDTYFFLADANHNVTAAVDDSDNAVDERYAYEAYGEVTFLEADFDVAADQKHGAISNRHLYTGREREPENTLQLNRHRYYLPSVGRWTTRDPIGYQSSDWNLYQYVLSRPITLIDPMGTDGYVWPGVDKPDPPEWHRCRNKHNKCPKTPPNTNVGGGVYDDYVKRCAWVKDPKTGYHGNNNCFRGFGKCRGSQCCYDPTTGTLDDSSPDMGTYDYCPPHDEGGGYSIPGAICHYLWDVDPHECHGGGYEAGCTFVY